MFGGLTYDPKRLRYPLTDRCAKRHALHWCREANKAVGGRVEAAVLALEFQKNGNQHFHPLVRLAGGLQHGDLAQLGQTWYQRHGYALLEPPRDRAAVAAYAAKYLVKDLARGDILFYPEHGDLRAHQPSYG